MSSVVLWEDRSTGVTVSWNKDGPYTVFVPLRIDEEGICDGDLSEWDSKAEALKAGRRAAGQRLTQMNAEDPATYRFRISWKDRAGLPLRTEDRLGEDLFLAGVLDEVAVRELARQPVSGVVRTSYGGEPVTVQRVE